MQPVRIVKPVSSDGPLIIAENGAITTTYETVWGNSNAYVYRSAAATMTISSGSANDTSAGTGARTCRVTGMTVSGGVYSLNSEVATMNGQTGVTLASQYIIINSVEIVTAGSGLTNAGIIYCGTGTVTTGVPATVDAYMAAGRGVTTHGFRGVPTNNQLSISRIQCASRNTTAGGHELCLRQYSISAGVWKDRLLLCHPNTIALDHDCPNVVTVVGPAFVEFRVLAGAGTGPYLLSAYGALGEGIQSC
jgi:hypothetical protein